MTSSKPERPLTRKQPLKTPEGRLLSSALELLETKGWCQRVFASRDGRHCAWGAVKVVTNALWPSLKYDRYERCMRYLDTAMGEAVDKFNDRRSTKFPDVRRAFKRAIRLAEARGK